MSWSTAQWWKIVCLDCGINTDLLRDEHFRIICRECLNKNEFNEVENEISQTEAPALGVNDSIQDILWDEQEGLS